MPASSGHVAATAFWGTEQHLTLEADQAPPAMI